jgi:ABC-type molybdate transport system permease subunit
MREPLAVSIVLYVLGCLGVCIGAAGLVSEIYRHASTLNLVISITGVVFGLLVMGLPRIVNAMDRMQRRKPRKLSGV